MVEDKKDLSAVNFDELVDEKGNILEKGMDVVYDIPEEISSESLGIFGEIVGFLEEKNINTLSNVMDFYQKRNATINQLGVACFVFLVSEIYGKKRAEWYPADIVLSVRSFVRTMKNQGDPSSNPFYVDLAVDCIKYTKQLSS